MSPKHDVMASEPFYWQVTHDNPIRYHDRLDHERCAALHNELVQRGWIGSGRSLDQLETVNWFQYYGQDAEDSQRLLSKDLVAFLEQAQMIKNDGQFCLFYYVTGLLSPDRMWETFDWMFEDEDKYRYLTLYGATSMASHPDGLAFDQRENRAVMQMSIHDSDVTLNGRTPWFPLEVTLSAWLDMIIVGKIQAVDDSFQGSEKNEPWICHHWNNFMVQETAHAFNALVESIETRMRNQGFSVPDILEPLLPDSVMDVLGIPPGFARSFVAKARHPAFTYIAPGLSVPTIQSFAQQPFYRGDDLHQEEELDAASLTVEPILLFASTESFQLADRKEREDPPFQHPHDKLSSVPAGVYFLESERQAVHGFEDAVKLVLPFGVGGDGFARISDGLQIGDERNLEDSSCGNRYTDLYQQGWNPFIEMHWVRLAKVLESWKGMVERGDWKVGANGIEGTMEAFKEADTEEGWWKFVVPIGW
jgi:hypothetical protein